LMNQRKKQYLHRWLLPIALSVVVHLLFFREISLIEPSPSKRDLGANERVKFKVLDPERAKRLIEALQKETVPPKTASASGQVNHRTKKERRVDVSRLRAKSANPSDRVGERLDGDLASKVQARQSRKPSSPIKDLSKNGPMLSVKSQNQYKNLLPTAQELQRYTKGGYVDYLDKKIPLGDFVDINTSEFRFIGYFTSMRKSIQQAWTYPYAAAMRGMQGVVGLQFVILKDGSVSKMRVVSSSGYEVLDRAIVDAISNAAPFAPLPANVNRELLPVRGNFVYSLGNTMRGH
jgi:periplasmic protein TonB